MCLMFILFFDSDDEKEEEEKKITVGVFVGRFQPLTKAHLTSIIHFLEKFDIVLVLIGSHGLPEFNEQNGIPVNPKNPYNTIIRRQMLEKALDDVIQEKNMDPEILKKMLFYGIHDSNHESGYKKDMSDFSKWNSDFHKIVMDGINTFYMPQSFNTWKSFSDNFTVYLCGSKKDDSTGTYLDKITNGFKKVGDEKEVIPVNYDGNPYLQNYFIPPILTEEGGSQTIDATFIRQLISEINQADKDLDWETVEEKMEELKKWVPETTIEVLQSHKKLAEIK